MTDDQRALWYLKKIPLFQELGSEEIAKLGEAVTITEARRRQVIYLPGDPARVVYFVNGGRVKISKVTRDGKELTLAYRGPGELFGEATLLGLGVREEMAEAAENSLLTEMSQETFERLLETHPLMGLRLARLLIQRRKDLENKIENLVFRDVSSKLAELLLRFAKEYGIEDARGIVLALRVTHQEMANLIGSTRETVSLTLSQLKRKGILRTEGRKIIIANREGLEALV